MAKRKESSKVDCFRVRSTTEIGHWRAGRYWGKFFVTVSADEVTDSMLADPRLEIVLDGVVAQSVIDGGKE